MCTLNVLTLKGRFAIADVVSAVACCASRLRSLTLDINATDQTAQGTHFPANLRLSRLHHLRVAGPFSLVLVCAINAPNLRKLVVERNGDWKLPENVWLSFLTAHPTLQMVAWLDVAFAQRVLLADNSESRTSLLPNLRKLFINYSNVDAEGVATLRGLVTHLQAASSSEGPKCMICLRESSRQSELFEPTQDISDHVRFLSQKSCLLSLRGY